MRRAIIVTHGRLGEAFIEVIERLLGPQEDVRIISNEGHSQREVRDDVVAAIEALPETDELYLFSDLAGGTCATTCASLAGRHPAVHEITGVNLPMLLEFFHYRDRTETLALLRRVLDKGRAGVVSTSAGEEKAGEEE